jgi:hypothetical protein
VECDEARDLMPSPGDRLRPRLAEHLRVCAACAAAAEREVRLDRMVAAAAVVAPPPDVAGRALAAALATLEAMPRPAVAVPRPSHARPAGQPSLAAYVLAGVLLAMAAGLLGLGPLGTLRATLAELVQPLTWVLTSPAVWLLPSPGRLAAAVLPWLGLIVLVWALRPQLAPRRPGVG